MLILETKEQNILSVEEVKSYLRISHSADDRLLASMIKAAISFAEKYIGSHFIPKIIEEKFEDSKEIILSQRPIIQIEEISHANYELVGDKIILDKKYAKIKIIYSVGVENPESLSPCLLEALKNHICLLYDKRGDPNLFSYQAKSFYRDFKEVRI